VQVNILEAKNRLSQLIKAGRAGEEVVIANRGEPVVRLVPTGPAPAVKAEAGNAQAILGWLKSDPLPAYARRSAEEIDAAIQIERSSWDACLVIYLAAISDATQRDGEREAGTIESTALYLGIEFDDALAIAEQALAGAAAPTCGLSIPALRGNDDKRATPGAHSEIEIGVVFRRRSAGKVIGEDRAKTRT
jgi:prevent-host-death family protein